VIEENNWDVEIREGRSDDSEPGEVLNQTPQAGESLKEGETVVLTVSLGRELRTVPTDLVGMPVDQAQAAITAAGLTPGDPQHEFSEDVPVGIVIRLADGTPPSAETDAPIAVVVSDGPQPREVPAIAPGTAPAAACGPIEAVQLVCAQGQAFSDSVPAGQVIGTQPAAGETVERGATVTVLVSQGPETIEVPNVSGRNVAEAVAALQGAGFDVEVLPQGATGRVIVTDPLPGERARRGSTISVFARR
jgi:serine/threonine-protein kinase